MGLALRNYNLLSTWYLRIKRDPDLKLVWEYPIAAHAFTPLNTLRGGELHLNFLLFRWFRLVMEPLPTKNPDTHKREAEKFVHLFQCEGCR